MDLQKYKIYVPNESSTNYNQTIFTGYKNVDRLILSFNQLNNPTFKNIWTKLINTKTTRSNFNLFRYFSIFKKKVICSEIYSKNGSFHLGKRLENSENPNLWSTCNQYV